MAHLLDSHIVLWYVAFPENLARKIKAIIDDSESDCYVSIVTFWEITIKLAKGTLQLEMDLEGLLNQCYDLRFGLLPIYPEHLLHLRNLPKDIYKDPFDRLIISQAISERMTLISSDSKFKEYSDLTLIS